MSPAEEANARRAPYFPLLRTALRNADPVPAEIPPWLSLEIVDSGGLAGWVRKNAFWQKKIRGVHARAIHHALSMGQSVPGPSWLVREIERIGLREWLSLYTVQPNREPPDAVSRVDGVGQAPSTTRNRCIPRDAPKAATPMPATFKTVAKEWYRCTSIHRSDFHNAEIRHCLVNSVLPRVGSQAIATIDSTALSTMVVSLGKPIPRDAAKHALWVAGQILRFAIATGRAPLVKGKEGQKATATKRVDPGKAFNSEHLAEILREATGAAKRTPMSSPGRSTKR